MAPAAPDLLAVDTDVLIDYLRDPPEAVNFLEDCQRPLALSVITVAELYAGVREGDERTRLDAFVEAFELLPLDSRRNSCHPQPAPLPHAQRSSGALREDLTPAPRSLVKRTPRSRRKTCWIEGSMIRDYSSY